MKKNVIKKLNLSGNLLELEIGKAFHKISFLKHELEFSVNEYCLQDVNAEFVKILNSNAENLSFDGHDQKGLGYVSQRVCMPDAKRISSALKNIGLKNIFCHSQYHFTLQYDKSNPLIEYNEMARETFLSAKPIGVKLLAADTPTPALAIIFESPELEVRFKELKEMGFKYDHDSFLAHVTVKYMPDDGDLELLEANLECLLKEVGGSKNEIYCGYEAWRLAK